MPAFQRFCYYYSINYAPYKNANYLMVTNYLIVYLFQRSSYTIICHVIFMCFLLAGNMMILHAISSHKELQSPTNLFLASLAVTDLLVTLVMPVDTVSLRFQWRIPDFPRRDANPHLGGAGIQFY